MKRNFEPGWPAHCPSLRTSRPWSALSRSSAEQGRHCSGRHPERGHRTRGGNGAIRRVADEGNGLEIAALLEYLRHYRFQISLNDLSDETGERVRNWEATARTYLRSIICEGRATG